VIENRAKVIATSHQPPLSISIRQLVVLLEVDWLIDCSRARQQKGGCTNIQYRTGEATSFFERTFPHRWAYSTLLFFFFFPHIMKCRELCLLCCILITDPSA